MSSNGAFAQDSSAREITSVRGDLYQVRDGQRITVFLVTPAGVILADPLNPDLARWLKAELASRFPDRPVRYVLHTGHRHERAAGGWVFDGTADLVAHANFMSARRRAAASLPPSLASLDRDRNDILERSEALASGAEALSKDRNQNGEVTTEEAWADVSSPEGTYHGRRMIELGGRRVELVHPGDGIGSDATVIWFPSERVLFAPGLPPLDEVPSSFTLTSAKAFLEALRQLERLEFDTLLSERGDRRTLADLAFVREYVEAMVEGVKAGVMKGESIEQIQASLALERFNRLRNFDAQRGPHIAETFRQLRMFTVNVSGSAEFMHLQRGTAACALSLPSTIRTACTGTGGRTFAGTGGASVMTGRLGGAVELSRTGIVTGVDQPFRSDARSFRSRETVTAFLFRYEAVPGRRLGLAVTGGVARISATQQYDADVGFFAPVNRKLTVTETTSVFGADLVGSLSGVRFTLPVRVLRAPEELYRAVGGTGPKRNLRVGIGVAVPVTRAVL